MSWLSDTWDSAVNTAGDVASGIGQAASYTVTYAGAGVAVVGGAVLDVADLAVEKTGALTGYDNWSLFEGSASGAALNFIKDGSANNLAVYIHNNPLDAGSAAMEGIQHGTASVAGTLVGIVPGAVGLVADTGNWGVYGAGKLVGQEWGYDGSAGLNWFVGTQEAVSGTVIDGTDWAGQQIGLENLAFDNMTKEQRVIFSSTKGITEVAADVAIIAATAGAGAGIIAATRTSGSLATRALAGSSRARSITGQWAKAAIDTKTGRILTGVDAAASIPAAVAEVENKFDAAVEQKRHSLELLLGS